MLRPAVTMEEYEQHLRLDEGMCLACGQEASECEPDTRERRCDACGEPAVYAFEEALVADLIDVVDPC